MKSIEELGHQIRESEIPAALAGEAFEMPALTAYLNHLCAATA